jgi:hypothetical protein
MVTAMLCCSAPTGCCRQLAQTRRRHSIAAISEALQKYGPAHLPRRSSESHSGLGLAAATARSPSQRTVRAGGDCWSSRAVRPDSPPGLGQPNYAPGSVDKSAFCQPGKYPRWIDRFHQFTFAPLVLSATTRARSAYRCPQHQHGLGTLVARIGLLFQPLPEFRTSSLAPSLQPLQLVRQDKDFLQYRPDAEPRRTFSGFKALKSPDSQEFVFSEGGRHTRNSEM